MIGTRQADGVTVVELAHGKVNAIDVELAEAVSATFGDLAAGGAPPVVLTGAGTCFSAGVDLRRLVDGGREYVERFMPALTRAFLAVFDYPGPLVAAIGGHCLAGGYVLAAGCDLRLAARDAGAIGLTELAAGVPFPAAALEIVRAAVGPPVARELVLTAARLDPAEAAARGVVDTLVDGPSLIDEALRRARALGAVPRAAYGLSKRQLHRPASLAIAEATAAYEAQVDAAWASPETAAFVASYLERLAGRAR